MNCTLFDNTDRNDTPQGSENIFTENAMEANVTTSRSKMNWIVIETIDSNETFCGLETVELGCTVIVLKKLMREILYCRPPVGSERNYILLKK